MGCAQVLLSLLLVGAAVYLFAVEPKMERKLLGLVPLGFLIGPWGVWVIVSIALTLTTGWISPTAVMIASIGFLVVHAVGLILAVQLMGTAKSNRAVARMDEM